MRRAPTLDGDLPELRREREETPTRRSRALAPVVAFVVLAVVVAVLPSFVSAFRAQQLAYVAIYLIALIGLNVLTGYTGQISSGTEPSWRSAGTRPRS